MNLGKITKVLIFLVFSAHLLIIESARAVAPITYTPSSLTPLGAGQSRTYTFTLDEPIICPGGVECKVTLIFSNNSSSTAKLDSNKVEWESADWIQTRSITLTVIPNLRYSHSANVILSTSAQSNAEFYRGYSININQSIALPASPEEIAAAEAEVAAQAERIRQIEIRNYKLILFEKLIKNLRPLLSDYRNAMYTKVNDRIIDKITDEILLLKTLDRSNDRTINSIIDTESFKDDFFNPNIRPSLETYNRYLVIGVTARTLSIVNAKLLELPVAKHSQLSEIELIANSVALVDRIANPETRASISAAFLISNNLIQSNLIYRHSVVAGLQTYPESSLNSMEKVVEAIKEQITKAEAPKHRLAAIKAKILARKR